MTFAPVKRLLLSKQACRFTFALALLGGAQLAALAAKPATRVITDMCGRKLTVPAKVERALSVSPPSQVLLYALAPERMVGWNMKLPPEAKPYMLPQSYGLPLLGGWSGGTTKGNPEVILSARPDVMLQMSAVDRSWLPETEQIQKQLGVPVVMVDGRLSQWPRTCEYLGPLLGVEARAKQLAAYCRAALEETSARLRTLPPSRPRPRFYCGMGAKGLMTVPAGSVHVEAFDYLRAVNVAQVSVPMASVGRADISMEQVLAWNPDWIVFANTPKHQSAAALCAALRKDPAWKLVNAVKTGHVATSPDAPFGWISGPPSINRILGVRFAAVMLYPDLFPPSELPKQVQTFYDLFYHVKITDSQARAFIRDALPASVLGRGF